MFILVFEIVAIVAMHAAKQNSNDALIKINGNIRPTPVFSSTISLENVVLFMPEYGK